MKNWLYCTAISLAAISGFVLDLAGATQLENTNILEVLQSKAVVIAAATTLSVSFPLVFELLAEVLSQKTLSNDLFERVLIVSMIYCGGTVALCSAYIPNIADVFVSVSIFQSTTAQGFILSLMNQYDPAVFSKRSLWVMFALNLVSSLLYKLAPLADLTSARLVTMSLLWSIFVLNSSCGHMRCSRSIAQAINRSLNGQSNGTMTSTWGLRRMYFPLSVSYYMLSVLE